MTRVAPLLLVLVACGAPESECRALESCLAAGDGVCAPILPIESGAIGGDAFVRCDGTACFGESGSDVSSLDDGRFRVRLYRRSEDPALIPFAGSWLGVAFTGDARGEGAFCRYRFSDFPDEEGCFERVRCATEGTIRAAPGGAGEADVTFADGTRVEARWYP